MADYGMQMPGGQARHGKPLTVYTALLFLTAVALSTAAVFLFLQAKKVSPDGSPFTMQEPDNIRIQTQR